MLGHMFYAHPAPRKSRHAVNWGVWAVSLDFPDADPILVADGFPTRASAEAEAARLNAPTPEVRTL